MKKLMWAISVFALVLTAVVLQFMPDSVPMHNDLAGNIDRWGSKCEKLLFPVIILKYFNLKAARTRLNLNPERFIPGLDIPMMYRDMYWASEGYIWEMVQRGDVDIHEMETGFSKLIAFWKSIYLRKE